MDNIVDASVVIRSIDNIVDCARAYSSIYLAEELRLQPQAILLLFCLVYDLFGLSVVYFWSGARGRKGAGLGGGKVEGRVGAAKGGT